MAFTESKVYKRRAIPVRADGLPRGMTATGMDLRIEVSMGMHT